MKKRALLFFAFGLFAGSAAIGDSDSESYIDSEEGSLFEQTQCRVLSAIQDGEKIEEQDLQFLLETYPVEDDIREFSRSHIDENLFEEVEQKLRECRVYQQLATAEMLLAPRVAYGYSSRYSASLISLSNFVPSLDFAKSVFDGYRDCRSTSCELSGLDEQLRTFDEEFKKYRRRGLFNSGHVTRIARNLPKALVPFLSKEYLDPAVQEQMKQPNHQFPNQYKREIENYMQQAFVYDIAEAHVLAEKLYFHISESGSIIPNESVIKSPKVAEVNRLTARGERFYKLKQETLNKLSRYVSDISATVGPDEKKVRFKNDVPQHLVGKRGRRKSHDR